MVGLPGNARSSGSMKVGLVKVAIRKLEGSQQKDLLVRLHLMTLQPLIDLLIADQHLHLLH